jgi:hypothetical protein
MMATWFQGPAAEFIDASRAGVARGVRILHSLGDSVIEINGERALAQTEMTISQRATIGGVACEVVCSGEFYDFLESREQRWGLVLRQPIYAADRLEAIDPAARVVLDGGLLASFPEGYRHLAYLQTDAGYSVKTDMPGLTGEAVESLHQDGAAWLAGAPLRAL